MTDALFHRKKRKDEPGGAKPTPEILSETIIPLRQLASEFTAVRLKHPLSRMNWAQAQNHTDMEQWEALPAIKNKHLESRKLPVFPQPVPSFNNPLGVIQWPQAHTNLANMDKVQVISEIANNRSKPGKPRFPRIYLTKTSINRFPHLHENARRSLPHTVIPHLPPLCMAISVRNLNGKELQKIFRDSCRFSAKATSGWKYYPSVAYLVHPDLMGQCHAVPIGFMSLVEMRGLINDGVPEGPVTRQEEMTVVEEAAMAVAVEYARESNATLLSKGSVAPTTMKLLRFDEAS